MWMDSPLSLVQILIDLLAARIKDTGAKRDCLGTSIRDWFQFSTLRRG